MKTNQERKGEEMKSKSRFVYVESKTKCNWFLLHSEFNGHVVDADSDALAAAAKLAENGSRAFVSTHYLGSGFFLK